MSSVNFSDDHTPVSTEVFLDTSIHCSMQKGSGFKSLIDSVLNRFTWKGASTYSKMEYGNVVLSTAEYFLRKLNEKGSLESTLAHIGHTLNSGQHAQKRTWAFTLLATTLGRTQDERTERARRSLERLLKFGPRYVEAICDTPLQDGTKCYWAKKDVEKKRNGSLSWVKPNCKCTLKRCEIDTFFFEHIDDFKKIKSAIDELDDKRKSPQLVGFSRVIELAIQDPSILLDYKSGCRQLGDAIIAVESKDFKNFFSMNAAESDLLTSLFAQVFYKLPANADKPVTITQPST